MNVKTSGALWRGAERGWRAWVGGLLLSYRYLPTEKLKTDFLIAALELDQVASGKWG